MVELWFTIFFVTLVYGGWLGCLLDGDFPWHNRWSLERRLWKAHHPERIRAAVKEDGGGGAGVNEDMAPGDSDLWEDRT